jgi:hypothetical protein
MARSRSRGRRRAAGGSRNGGAGIFEELGFRGLSSAVEAHIHDLVYDLLKDREWQEFMREWASRGLSILLRRQLKRGGARRRR